MKRVLVYKRKKVRDEGRKKRKRDKLRTRSISRINLQNTGGKSANWRKPFRQVKSIKCYLAQLKQYLRKYLNVLLAIPKRFSKSIRMFRRCILVAIDLHWMQVVLLGMSFLREWNSLIFKDNIPIYLCHILSLCIYYSLFGFRLSRTPSAALRGELAHWLQRSNFLFDMITPRHEEFSSVFSSLGHCQQLS